MRQADDETNEEKATEARGKITLGMDVFSEKNLRTIIGVFVLVGLYLISTYNYLLFHSLIEIFTILVACGIFMFVWNSRKYIDNNYIVIIGIALLFISLVDLVHTLTFKGMGVFPDQGSNLATQLWIAARYMQALTFLIAALLFGRKVNFNFVLAGYAAITALVLASTVVWDVFPIAYVDGAGLTPFKVYSEYLISAMFLASLYLLHRNRGQFKPSIYRLIAISVIFTVFAELAFTSYVSVYGFANMLGHIFKLFAFYLLYLAVIRTGLTRPYDMILANLKESKEQLKEERDRVKAYLDVAGVMLVAIDANRKVVLINRKGCEILGYEQDEVIGRNWYENFVPERIRKEVIATSDRLIRGEVKSVEYFENPILTKNGEERLIAWHNTILRDGAGKITGTLSSGEDITERRKTEGALHDSQENFRIITTNTPDHVLMQDRDLRYVMVLNPQMGLTEKDMLGRTDHDFLSKGDADSLTKIKRSVLETGKPVKLTAPLVSPKGVTEYFEGSYIPKRDSQGRIDGLIGYFRNVTEQKKIEEAIQESEGRLRALYQSMTEGLAIHEVVYDGDRAVDYAIIDVNPAFERITGLARKDAVGRKASELYGTGEAPYLDVYARVASGGAPGSFETYFKPMDKHFVISVFSPEKGRFATVFSDITERKKAEGEIKQKVAEINAKNKELSFFNKVMVGRELRMMDMKKEVNELLKRLGEPPKYPTNQNEGKT